MENIALESINIARCFSLMLYNTNSGGKSPKAVIKGEDSFCKCTHNSRYNVFGGEKVALFKIWSYILA